MGELRNAHKILVEGKRPSRRHRRITEDNIKVGLNRRVRIWTDSSASGQGPLAGSCESGNEPSVSIKDRIY
jgi:hypothetical protein